MLLILLFVIVSAANPCRPGDYRTDPKTREVYLCTPKRQWNFHAKMMRQTSTLPKSALISNNCENNPDLVGSISGFFCNAQHEMAILNCINTKLAYFCLQGQWSVYMIHSKKLIV